ncbi:hypothetical protein BDY21DRAFT_284474, partial [Lineolata rhizophorae]
MEDQDAQTREAMDYWGYMFEENKCGTKKLNQLLSGIWDHISKNIDPAEYQDVNPTQLAAFYRAVGGDYDALFVETPPTSIAFIYKSIGCLHSLQPAPDDDGYGAPQIPALKKKGYITWQTIQLLLGPEEHVPFLQNAVDKFDIIDPETNRPFPKLLPREAFPDHPDPSMIEWYEDVANKLRAEAEQQGNERRNRTNVGTTSPTAEAPNGGSAHHRRNSSEESKDGSADERTGAAEYFRNPLYRNREGRPTVVHRYSK